MSGIPGLDEHVKDLRAQCSDAERRLRALHIQVASAEQQFRALRARLQQAESHAHLSKANDIAFDNIKQNQASLYDQTARDLHVNASRSVNKYPLSSDEYKRYGRQLLIPEIGAYGQAALKQARVLIVGIGGLGCPAAAYLAGAGVGMIGLVDGDVVEVSNLHRQIAHSTGRVGMSKVASAHTYLSGLNPLVHFEQHHEHLAPESAIRLFEQYDIVLDCTDHPTSRYLISDACVLTGRPLVSASALKTEGQLIVLNNPPAPAGNSKGGPCYRCIFPRPPPADTIVSCGEGGILGPVVGIMGVLQALEAIKVLTKPPTKANLDTASPRASMLLFSAYGDVQFRTMKMRSRKPACAACSDQCSISRESLSSGSLDYVAFCGAGSTTDRLPNKHRATVHHLADHGFTATSRIIDVRDNTQFELCSLQGSINIPWTGDASSWQKIAQNTELEPSGNMYIICRNGNDSQAAALALMSTQPDAADKIQDVQGGFAAWRQEVDPDWPDY